MTIKILRFFLFTFICTLFGCTTAPKSEMKLPWVKEKPKTPERFSYTWSAYEQTNPKPGGPVLRGIGGRFIFFEGAHKKPVKIDGTMRFYVFDGENPMHEMIPGKVEPPLIESVYPPEKVKKCYHKNQLGHGYEFFIPIDPRDQAPGWPNPERRVYVICRFEDAKTGEIVIPEAQYVTLPGPPKEEMVAESSTKPPANTADDSNNPIRLVSAKMYNDREVKFKVIEEANREEELRKRTVTTFTAPEEVTRYLMGADVSPQDIRYQNRSSEPYPYYDDSPETQKPANEANSGGIKMNTSFDQELHSGQTDNINRRFTDEGLARELSNRFGHNQSPAASSRSSQQYREDPRNEPLPSGQDTLHHTQVLYGPPR